MMTFTDEATAWSEIAGLRLKSDAFAAYKAYEARLMTQRKVAIKEIHCDGGGEYVNDVFDAHLCEKGTICTMTVHNTSEQNGIAERLNRTLLEHARAMLFTAGLPRYLWLEAVRHATYLKNRSPTRVLDGTTPHEAMGYGVPDIADLHEWGCTVWVQIEAGKLDARAVETRFVGYDDERKGFCVYWPTKRRISVERNVRFVPNQILIPEGTQSKREPLEQQQPPPTQGLPVLAPIPSGSQQVVPKTQPVDPRAAESDDENPPIVPRRLPDSLDPPIPGYGRGEQFRREPGEYAHLHSKGRTQTEALAEEVDEPEDETLEDFALATRDEDDPKSMSDALARPEAEEWKTAMKTEIKQLERLGTWELVYPPANVNIIDSGFVYRKKRDNRGNITSYKARFVGKGYSQVYGVDYFDTFAPSVKLTSQRVVLSFAAREDWEIHQVDVKGAYLNAVLPETVYMKPLMGYLAPEQHGMVCKLLKGLYGVKQAGHEWYRKLRGTFTTLGFIRSEADHGVFYILGTDPIIVTVSTDDMIIAAKYLETVTRFKNDLKRFYDISDLGEIHWVLGIEIKRDRMARTISLSQRTYIDTILEEFKLKDAAPLTVPAEPGAILGKHQCPESTREKEDMANVPYARGVGKVMYYYVATGPQIGYITRVLAQFMANPDRPHWEALKRVMRYMKGAKDEWLTLGRTGDELEGYTDADFASQQDRHSISGYVVRYRGSAISWSSKHQTLIALSTTEAEYIAAAHAVKEAIWLRWFLGEIVSPSILPIPLFCDNNGSIALAKDDNVFHPRTKHIDIRFHFIHQYIENREVTMVYINTNDNPADILTKPLPRAKFKPFATSMGIAAIGHSA